MKRKWIFWIAAVVFLSIALSACHITEPPCPAYAYKAQKQMHADKKQ